MFQSFYWQKKTAARQRRPTKVKTKFSIGVGLLACTFILALTSEAARAQRTDWRMTFVPIDPWRAIGGQTNYVKLNGVQFCGKIVEVRPYEHGIRIEGEWGPLGTVYYPIPGWDYLADPPQYADFFVTNYPYVAFPGQNIPSAERLMAWSAGTYTYKTVKGVTRTIRMLDYGTPCGPNPVLIAARQKELQKANEKKREAALRTIEALEREATNGDSSAQYSLGFHYLHGLGCDTNEVMGLYWLLQSAAQGNMSASNDLQEIQDETEIESTATNGTRAFNR